MVGKIGKRIKIFPKMFQEKVGNLLNFFLKCFRNFPKIIEGDLIKNGNFNLIKIAKIPFIFLLNPEFPKIHLKIPRIQFQEKVLKK